MPVKDSNKSSESGSSPEVKPEKVINYKKTSIEPLAKNVESPHPTIHYATTYNKNFNSQGVFDISVKFADKNNSISSIENNYSQMNVTEYSTDKLWGEASIAR